MRNNSHRYKVINARGMIYVTYNSYADAEQFVTNIFKERGIRLVIKEQDTYRQAGGI